MFFYENYPFGVDIDKIKDERKSEKMQTKNLKRLGILIVTIVMTVCMLSEGITALAAATTDKTYTLSGWGYDFRNSGLPNAYDPLTQSNSNLPLGNNRFSF